ncbi:MAG: rod-binding protein [Spirochaetes bacterium]|nr:rod-binding protein [Spirochaetota bacterium]
MTGKLGMMQSNQLTSLGLSQKNKSNALSIKGNAKRFSELLKQNKSYKGKLQKTCIEMESLFVKQMLTVMRKTVHKTGLLDGGHAEEIFTDMLYDKYALKMSKNHSFGLAKSLYRQLSHGAKW